MLPLLGLAALSFILSGGIDKVGRQFNDDPMDNPSLGEWAGTGVSTALGGAFGLPGVAGVPGLLAKTAVPTIARSVFPEAVAGADALGLGSRFAQYAAPFAQFGDEASTLAAGLPTFARAAAGYIPGAMSSLLTPHLGSYASAAQAWAPQAAFNAFQSPMGRRLVR